LDEDAGDLGVFKYFGPALTGACGKRLGSVDRIDLSVLGEEYPSDRALEIIMRQAFADLIHADHIDLEAEVLGHRRAALQFFHAAFIQGDGNRTVLFEARGSAGFLFQPFEKAGGIFGELGQIAVAPKLADQSRRVPGRSTSQLFAFEKNDVRNPSLYQVVG